MSAWGNEWMISLLTSHCQILRVQLQVTINVVFVQVSSARLLSFCIRSIYTIMQRKQSSSGQEGNEKPSSRCIAYLALDANEDRWLGACSVRLGDRQRGHCHHTDAHQFEINARKNKPRGDETTIKPDAKHNFTTNPTYNYQNVYRSVYNLSFGLLPTPRLKATSLSDMFNTLPDIN